MAGGEDPLVARIPSGEGKLNNKHKVSSLDCLVTGADKVSTLEPWENLGRIREESGIYQW